MNWTKTTYPGDAAVIVRMQRNNEIGNIYIQVYGDKSFLVAVYLPGQQTHVEGDAPKTEPEKSSWVNEKIKAENKLEEFVKEAIENGWQELPYLVA